MTNVNDIMNRWECAIAREIDHMIASAKDDIKAFARKMTEEVEQERYDVARIMEWNGNDATKSKAVIEILTGVLDDNGSLVKSELLRAHQDAIRIVREFFGSNSNNIFANAVDCARAEQAHSLMERLGHWVDWVSLTNESE